MENNEEIKEEVIEEVKEEVKEAQPQVEEKLTRKEKRKLKKARTRATKRLVWCLVLVVLLCASVYFSPEISKYVSYLRQGEPVSQVTGEIMGKKTITIRDAILGESTEKESLIVLEQEASVESELSTSIADMKIFKKAKTIYSYGTGVYTVDLSGLDKEKIEVNSDLMTVTVKIPHAMLSYVNIDVDKTSFDETAKGLLAFGDIKLTQEQQKVLSQEINAEMTRSLSTEEMLSKADTAALKSVKTFISQIVSALAPEYSIIVEFE